VAELPQAAARKAMLDMAISMPSHLAWMRESLNILNM